MSGAVLELNDLSVGYGLSRGERRVVLAGLSVALHAGEFACLLGPNGVGKSTLLRTAAAMQKPLAGTVTIGGVDVRKLRPRALAQRLGVVLTERVQVGILAAYDLVGLGRYPYTGWAGRLTERDHAVVRWAIAATGSEDLAARNVAELSDGERQRVMIARALAQEPAAMLLDEPTAFLDVSRRVEITGLLQRLARESGLAVLLSTHDLELALRTADTIWLVAPDGRFRAGAPEDLALDGTLEAAFRGPDLAFDREAGGFRLHRPYAGRARLRGEGLAAVWTRRLLEREGLELVDPAATVPVDFEVECLARATGPAWRTAGPGGTREHTTLGALAAYLRERVDGRAAGGTGRPASAAPVQPVASGIVNPS
jgi:iron complex transport system ATP-binding protein